jgi:hypothetical protein
LSTDIEVGHILSHNLDANKRKESKYINIGNMGNMGDTSPLFWACRRTKYEEWDSKSMDLYNGIRFSESYTQRSGGMHTRVSLVLTILILSGLWVNFHLANQFADLTSACSPFVPFGILG